MKVTIKDVEHIAKLANLKLTEKEAEKMAEEFSGILTHFDNIKNENLDGIEMYSFEDEPTKLRDDKVIEFENKEELFKNVKDMIETSIKIPKVVE